MPFLFWIKGDKNIMAKTMTKTNSTKDKTTVAQETAQEIVAEPVTIAPVVEVKQPKKYEPNDLIPCRSMYAGCLLFTGDKSKITYEFSNIGDFRYIEYQDLLAAMLVQKKSLFAPYIIIDDEELLDSPHWKQVKAIYDGMYTEKDLINLINLPTSQFSEEYRKIPRGFQKTIATMISGMIADGTFDSMNKIRIIDEVCGTDLAVLFK